ncbi:MAG: hypothetical protein JW780_01030 [Clostridiales bacterium]|nr:hypothetical protein [Clostridiales bacterium]
MVCGKYRPSADVASIVASDGQQIKPFSDTDLDLSYVEHHGRLIGRRLKLLFEGKLRIQRSARFG